MYHQWHKARSDIGNRDTLLDLHRNFKQVDWFEFIRVYEDVNVMSTFQLDKEDAHFEDNAPEPDTEWIPAVIVGIPVATYTRPPHLTPAIKECVMVMDNSAFGETSTVPAITTIERTPTLETMI